MHDKIYQISSKRTLSNFSLAILLLALISAASAARFNGFGHKFYTIETQHFRLNYQTGLEHLAKKSGEILEDLYNIYRNTYHITLPKKTEVLILNDYSGMVWALAIQNIITIEANDFDYRLRGTANYLRDALAHEFAHIMSISTGFKFPAWMPYLQFGYFTHPNNIHATNKDSTLLGTRLEAFHIFPSEILPPWFYEGIAQFESSRNSGDSWDTHRDMILRTLSISDRLLSWDHMAVFTGKEDDYEKTYNHGFSLIKYLSETYGDETIRAILRESTKVGRVTFDRTIKAVLGISGRQLYREWSESLKKHYTRQIDSIGEQVFGKKINKHGFDNIWPRFGPNQEKIFFLSNGKLDYAYAFKSLYSYNLNDTVKEEKRIKMEMPGVKSFYDIHDTSQRITYSSLKSRKSTLSPKNGGFRVKDIFIDTLILGKKKKKLFSKKTEQQISEKQWLNHAVFSPKGDQLACSKQIVDKYFLVLIDTSGKNLQYLYPPENDAKLQIQTIYSLDWSPDGKFIAVSYIDKNDRKIGLYNVKDKTFQNVCDTEFDERDPRFSRNSQTIYFTSDRTGIFNIYRYHLQQHRLQRLTNVSGGAFTPDASADEKKLAFANYDPDGYGIYLIDSLSIIEEFNLSSDSSLPQRKGIEPSQSMSSKVDFSSPVKYNRFPRKGMVIPTFFVEQVLSENDNTYKGITNTKIGAVFNINDPLDWLGKGSSVGGYFLSETINPFKIFDRSEKINRSLSYDLGIFGSTKLLPLDLSFFYAQRAIAGEDEFKHDYYGVDTVEVLKYNLNPRITEIKLTHSLGYTFGFNLFATFDKYKVWTEIDNKYYEYIPARGYRVGTFFTMRQRVPDARMNISPKGKFLKLKYEFWNQKLIDQEKAFSFDENDDGSYSLKWNYDKFQFNQVSGNLIYARSAPWYRKHDMEFKVDGTVLQLTKECRKRLKEKHDNSAFPELHPTDLPSFYKPSEWIPGYAYYYRDTVDVYTDSAGIITDTLRMPVDTVLVSGNGLVKASFAYRFPLTKHSIDKKFWFLYFERLYGAFNFGGAVAVDKLSDFKDLQRRDFLLWRGIELRLETVSFNSFPLAITANWDYGIDHSAPLGGHKFALKFGFSFDNWDIIVEPDGNHFKSRFFF